MRRASQLLRTGLVSLLLPTAFGCGSSPQEQASFPDPEPRFGRQELASVEAQPEATASGERDASSDDVSTLDDASSPDAYGATPLSDERAAALAAELANDPTDMGGGLDMGRGSGSAYQPDPASMLAGHLHAMTPGFRRCFKKLGVALDPEMRGSVVLKIRVRTDGAVEKVEPVDAKGLSPELISCLVGRAFSQQFPEIPKPTVVIAPLMFEP